MVAELAGHVGEDAVVDWCVGILDGADLFEREDWAPYFGRGIRWAHRHPDTPWPKIWATRALRYVWRPRAAPAVIEALHDPHWRLAEMAILVVGQRDLSEAGDLVAGLAGHVPARVRKACARTLGVVGDTDR